MDNRPIIVAAEERPWYKKGWGITVLLISGLVVLFLLYVGRYAYLYSVGKIPLTLEDISRSFTPAGDALPKVKEASPSVTVNLWNPKDPFTGPADAVLTVVEFGDFQCPFCKQAYPVVRQLMAKYQTKVRFQYRHFPVATIHPDALNAAEASMCANEQGKFWPYHDLLFANQEDLSVAGLSRSADQAGLDQDAFNKCLAADRYRALIEQDLNEGIAAGVRGTPTFFFNGVKVEGAIPLDVFDQLLAGSLNLLEK